MPIHDQVAVTGVSEACKYNDHSDCRAPRCGCTCHIPPPSQGDIELKLSQMAGVGPQKACPKCGVKRPQSETFCRIDGERLASLLCGVCGSGMEVEDAFCWSCSSPKGKVAASGYDITSPKPTVLAVPELSGGRDVDYGQRILRELQAEMAEGKVDDINEPQVVVEKPAGSQGSFTIVDKPNPNKVRGPGNTGAPSTAVPVSIPGHRKPIRLPVKPT